MTDAERDALGLDELDPQNGEIDRDFVRRHLGVQVDVIRDEIAEMTDRLDALKADGNLDAAGMVEAREWYDGRRSASALIELMSFDLMFKGMTETTLADVGQDS